MESEMKKLCLLVVALAATFTAFAGGRKAISILGDSYSTYQGYMSCDSNRLWYWDKPNVKYINTDVDDVRQTWWHLLISSNPDYRLCLNNSFSGATICHTGYRKENYSNRSFENRCTALGCPDIILICGGTNDSWADSPIGEYKYEDWTPEDLFFFRPAMASMLNKIRLHYPNVEVYFILNSELKPEINESVDVVCAHYGVPVIKMHAIDKSHGHPNRAGMKAFADQVRAVIEK